MDWHQGSSYLLPRREGIACGWIHELAGGGGDGGDARGGGDRDVDDAAAGGGGDFAIAGGGIGGPTTTTTAAADDDVVLYSLKVSAEDLRGMEDGTPAAGESTWVRESRGLFLGRLAGRAGEARMRRPPRPRSSDDDRHRREGGGDGGAATEDDDGTTTIALPVPPVGIVLSDDETLTMRRIIDLAR